MPVQYEDASVLPKGALGECFSSPAAAGSLPYQYRPEKEGRMVVQVGLMFGFVRLR